MFSFENGKPVSVEFYMKWKFNFIILFIKKKILKKVLSHYFTLVTEMHKQISLPKFVLSFTFQIFVTV